MKGILRAFVVDITAVCCSTIAVSKVVPSSRVDTVMLDTAWVIVSTERVVFRDTSIRSPFWAHEKNINQTGDLEQMQFRQIFRRIVITL